jgi:hypothetical protein
MNMQGDDKLGGGGKRGAYRRQLSGAQFKSLKPSFCLRLPRGTWLTARCLDVDVWFVASANSSAYRLVSWRETVADY